MTIRESIGRAINRTYSDESGDFRWWIRYPCGLMLLGGAAWYLLSHQNVGNPELLLCGLVALIALGVMYELGCLVIALVLFWLFSIAVDWIGGFLPDSWKEQASWAWFAVVIAFWVCAAQIIGLRAEIDALKREVENLKRFR